MQSARSCIVREAVLDREYRVSPPERWDAGNRTRSPQKPQSRKPRRRRSRTTPFLILGLTLFLCGFLLGRALADGKPPAEQDAVTSPDSEQEPVRVFDVIGAVRAGQSSGQAGTGGADSSGQAGTGDVQFSGQAGTGGANSSGQAGTGGANSSGQTGTGGADSSGQTGTGDVQFSGQAGTGGANSSGQTGDWNLRLVNGWNPLPEDFAVPELTQLKNGHAIDSRAYPDLQAMMDAARAEGYQPLICSSFRSRDRQEELYQQKVRFYLGQGSSQAEAEEQAAYWVARPGTSEHQTGLAVDIVDKDYQLLDRDQEKRPVQKWLMEHCAEYGFILRYPVEKSGLTGVGYEPWHYRYVGRNAAKEIMSAGICLEEYLCP